MEYMGALDAAFWELEDTHCGLHVASVAVFDGPPPTLAEVRDLYRRKLHLVPRLRQRMRRIPLGIGRPAWVDDPEFDLSYHVRACGLPRPGGTAELTTLMGRLMSTHLDPDRPLWQVSVVDGLAGGRWAIISKLHHSMVDGIAGISVLTSIFDTTAEAARVPLDHWIPQPHSSADVLVSTVRAQLRSAVPTFRRLIASTANPRRRARQLRSFASGLRGYTAALTPGSSARLTGSLGTRRAYAVASVDLADLAAVREQHGGTVNDVVLAMVTTGMRDLLLERGEAPTPHLVRCLVPVSVRADGDSATNNQVSAIFADLPTEFADPFSRYAAITARTQALKSSGEALTGATLVSLARYLPPAALQLGLRAAFRLPQRAVSSVVTNVRGPAHRLFVLGRPMIAHYPYVPLADRVRIGIAVTSYGDQLYFGITTDNDSVPDADVLQAGIVRGLAELRADINGMVRQ